jgi:hypothetical protein
MFLLPSSPTLLPTSGEGSFILPSRKKPKYCVLNPLPHAGEATMPASDATRKVRLETKKVAHSAG